jgi:serine/threonine protein kinase
VLGSGNFGTARVASLIANPNIQFAIKSIPRAKIESDMNLFEQELDILLSVDHPNIVKFFEAFLDHKYVHLVMESCDGGELFERLQRITLFKEEDAKAIIRQSL